MKVKAGIVGFRGYSGAELVRILERHPHAEVCLLEHRQDSTGRPALTLSTFNRARRATSK